MCQVRVAALAGALPPGTLQVSAGAVESVGLPTVRDAFQIFEVRAQRYPGGRLVLTARRASPRRAVVHPAQPLVYSTALCCC